MDVLSHFSLLLYNSFKIDVKSRWFVEYSSEEDLIELLKEDILKNNRFLHIGGGCNVLFMNDFDGVILHSGIKGIELIREDENFVYYRVGAGEVWDDFVRFVVEKNISGIENLSAIPGEVGATPIQNIGAYGVEVKDVISEVQAIEIKTGGKRVFSNEECAFGYRDSIFKQALKGQYIVTYVVYRLKKLAKYSLQYGNLSAEVEKYGAITLENIRKAVVAIRSEKLPDHKTIGNAGSFFMNPIISRSYFEVLQSTYPSIPHYSVSETEVKVPAGWLIEECGWKGKSHGNAAVHNKQALVLINKGNASGKEIMELASLIEKSVKEKFDITIHPEVIVVS